MGTKMRIKMTEKWFTVNAPERDLSKNDDKMHFLWLQQFELR
jgi:hypothetical protein